jgi:hypothetical protein
VALLHVGDEPARDDAGWSGQCAYADAAHRVHAGVEDVIRTGKDTGLGHFPSRDYGTSQAWLDAAMTGCILQAWLKLTALDGDLARAEPKTLRPASCASPPAWSAADAAKHSRSPSTGPGPMTSSPPGSPSVPSRPRPDQQKTVPPSRKGIPGPVEPRPVGPTAGPPSYPHPKILS